MLEVEGKVTNGVVVLTTPGTLPEGAKVRVVVEDPTDKPQIGMREEDWPTTPEGIESHLQRMRDFDPVVLTPDEEASLAAWRAEMKRFNIEAMRKQMESPE